MTDPLHNRDPTKCQYPNVEETKYNCLGCRQRQPVEHANHNYEEGECRYGPGGDLEQPERRLLGQRRTGAALREPSTRPSSSPVASAQPQLADGTDLAKEDEEQAMSRAALMREDRPDAKIREALRTGPPPGAPASSSQSAPPAADGLAKINHEKIGVANVILAPRAAKKLSIQKIFQDQKHLETGLDSILGQA